MRPLRPLSSAEAVPENRHPALPSASVRFRSKAGIQCSRSPESDGSSDGRGVHPNNFVAIRAANAAPVSCATMKAGASLGAIPANVSDRERAIVTAGFANDVAP